MKELPIRNYDRVLRYIYDNPTKWMFDELYSEE